MERHSERNGLVSVDWEPDFPPVAGPSVDCSPRRWGDAKVDEYASSVVAVVDAPWQQSVASYRGNFGSLCRVAQDGGSVESRMRWYRSDVVNVIMGFEL